MAQQPSAAAALFPHLPHDDGRVADWAEQRRDRDDVAAALYPDRTPKAKPPPNPYRDRLLADLRELNARIDARLARERQGGR